MKSAAKVLSGLVLAIIGGLLTQLILNWIPHTREAVETYVSSVDALSGGVDEGSREAGYVYLFLPLMFAFVALLGAWAALRWLDHDETWDDAWSIGTHCFLLMFWVLIGLAGAQSTVQGLIAPEDPKYCIARYCRELSELPSYSPSGPARSLTVTRPSEGVDRLGGALLLGR